MQVVDNGEAFTVVLISFIFQEQSIQVNYTRVVYTLVTFDINHFPIVLQVA